METAVSVIANLISLGLLVGAIVWVYLDARAIGTDRGRIPGLVDTKPMAWATGVFLMLIVVVPVYLVMRVRYKRLAAERRAQFALMPGQEHEEAEADPGVWPPPPKSPLL